MRLLLFLLIISTYIFKGHAQNLSQDQQKKLIEEVRVLREKVRDLENKKDTTPASSNPAMMDTLQKGRQYQEDQIKALEELDRED